MARFISTAYAFILCVLCVAEANAQTDFASGFSPGGLAQHADGRVLIVEQNIPGNLLAFNVDGTGRTDFVAGIDGPTDVVQLADGRILVTAFFPNTVLAFDADGNSLANFATGVTAPGRILQLRDGRVLVAESNDGNILVFNSDGTGRAQFATGLNGPTGITQLADGRVIANSGADIVAFDSTGTPLANFATAVSGGAHDITQLQDGRIVAAQFPDGKVVAFESDGTGPTDFADGPASPRGILQLADGRLLISGQGTSVVAIDVMPTANERSPERPSLFSIADAYPNPFDGVTTVPFTLMNNAEIRMAAYDALGREVGVLVHGRFPAGSHTAAFDAGALRSGVYFVRLVAADHVESRSVLLLK